MSLPPLAIYVGSGRPQSAMAAERHLEVTLAQYAGEGAPVRLVGCHFDGV